MMQAPVANYTLTLYQYKLNDKSKYNLQPEVELPITIEFKGWHSICIVSFLSQTIFMFSLDFFKVQQIL